MPVVLYQFGRKPWVYAREKQKNSRLNWIGWPISLRHHLKTSFQSNMVEALKERTNDPINTISACSRKTASFREAQ